MKNYFDTNFQLNSLIERASPTALPISEFLAEFRNSVSYDVSNKKLQFFKLKFFIENQYDILKNSPLFRGLGKDDIAAVLGNTGARVRKVKAEAYILHVGDMTSEMGIVLSGSVLVIQEDLWGHRNIMSRVSAGEIFAEVFAAASVPLNVSVAAHKDCEILFLDVNRLLSLPGSAHSALVIRNLISVLAKKTMAFNEKVTHISKRTTREKLLSYLSAQSIRHGSPSFDIAFNRQQLADYLCVERAAMCAELSKLQKEGVLQYSKKHFELKEMEEV